MFTFKLRGEFALDICRLSPRTGSLKDAANATNSLHCHQDQFALIICKIMQECQAAVIYPGFFTASDTQKKPFPRRASAAAM